MNQVNEHGVRKVVVLGSSALKIGEAGEFDYSGSQAIKALREEGIETVLINPNIATIQTSEDLADRVYFLPVTARFVEQVIERERPDGILLGFGGQTALNCGLELERGGVLERLGVRVLGTPVSTIVDTEDRDRFTARLDEIGVLTPESKAVGNTDEAVVVAQQLGFPVMLRIAYALGGLGSGLCRDEKDLRERAEKAFAHTDQILIEEYLTGWKEVEYEVVRDRHNNCVTVCNMENVDPLGIHTGESIVVAPSQTLSNSEYHMLRELAIRIVRHLGVVGECNVQYALAPDSEEYRVIEVNARLSRSSALASKATEYPLAFVASKLSLGYGLHELPNSITQVTKAFFEPALDYVVVKMPRWDLGKFKRVSKRIGSAMKSVGEVMAIGRNFEEAVQKATRMLDIGAHGLAGNDSMGIEDLEGELVRPTEHRMFAVAAALREGMGVDRIHELTHIDPWFLDRIHSIVRLGAMLGGCGSLDGVDEGLLRIAKQRGFSDKGVSILVGCEEEAVWQLRAALGIKPVVRQIDTLAAEFPAQTNYLYMTYNGTGDDAAFPLENAVMLLGSGSYRIGCSVEFDWCCVNAGRTLKRLGYKAVMVNYNPETVSTDYDEFHQLFFDEISFESVREIAEKVAPTGVIVSVGGQISNNLAMRLDRAGIPLLGTSADSIDAAENRHRFSSLLDELKIDQPEWAELSTLGEARRFAGDVGYPVLVRPSYVLSGAAMAVASNDKELSRYLEQAALVSPEHPTVISKYIENAKEIEFDAVAKDGEIVVYAISEHVENAGVHSGDATLVFPAQRTYLETIRQIRKASRRIAQKLGINGPFNIQFIAKDNRVRVIECNLRASRSFPFVSKVIRQNFIDMATCAMMGEEVARPDKSAFDLNYVGVKAPQFSFTRLDGADPTLGVEMASTGEVGCLGLDFSEAFLKSLISVGFHFPIERVLLSVGPLRAKTELLESMRSLSEHGTKLSATGGTAVFLEEHGIPVEHVGRPLDDAEKSAADLIREGAFDLVINIPRADREDELTNGYIVRRTAVDHGVPLVTNRQIAMRLAEALVQCEPGALEIRSWSEYTSAGV